MGNCLRRKDTSRVSVSPRDETEFVCRACSSVLSSATQAVESCSRVMTNGDLADYLSHNHRWYDEILLAAHRGHGLPLVPLLVRGRNLVTMYIHLQECDFLPEDKRREMVQHGLLNWIANFEEAARSCPENKDEPGMNALVTRLSAPGGAFKLEEEEGEEMLPLRGAD